MKIKELITKLHQLDPERPVYLGSNELDEDTYYYLVEDVVVVDVDATNIVVLTYRE